MVPGGLGVPRQSGEPMHLAPPVLFPLSVEPVIIQLGEQSTFRQWLADRRIGDRIYPDFRRQETNEVSLTVKVNSGLAPSLTDCPDCGTEIGSRLWGFWPKSRGKVRAPMRTGMQG
jgi:hypothetical protein